MYETFRDVVRAKELGVMKHMKPEENSMITGQDSKRWEKREGKNMKMS